MGCREPIAVTKTPSAADHPPSSTGDIPFCVHTLRRHSWKNTLNESEGDIDDVANEKRGT